MKIGDFVQKSFMNRGFSIKTEDRKKMAEFAAHGANQEEKMAAEKAKKTIVIGHKTRIRIRFVLQSAMRISKHFSTAGEYVPVPCGELNPETTFVLVTLR